MDRMDAIEKKVDEPQKSSEIWMKLVGPVFLIFYNTIKLSTHLQIFRTVITDISMFDRTKRV